MDNLPLIDFSKEDDCLLPLSFRDSIEDVKLSCAGFDNASMIKRGKMSPVEERRRSELRKSLDWNSAFFTSQEGDALEEQEDDSGDRTEEWSITVGLMFLEIHLDEAPEGDSFEQ
nr:hypothetical protein [Tanacetum cinerariifolium]